MSKPKRELPPALRANADKLKRGEPLKGTRKQQSPKTQPKPRRKQGR